MVPYPAGQKQSDIPAVDIDGGGRAVLKHSLDKFIYTGGISSEPNR